MFSHVMIGFVWLILLHLKSNMAMRHCNVTLETATGTFKQVSSPYIETDMIGSSLICWYIIRSKPSIQDISISLDFTRFNIGTLSGNSCKDGYLQIQDSKYSKVNEDLGFYCGSIEQPHLVIRQADTIKLLFVSENVTRYTEWLFTLRSLTKSELPERFGSHPEYFPGRIGAIVEETYCETVFQDCREQNCYVQSPGYPGVYPRGVACRYYLATKLPLIRLYVEGGDWDSFSVDGRRCENPLECDIRELSTEDCPYDYIRIYDGLDEYSPLIAKFCGLGHFPNSIVGTSNKLFLEFVSSRYGPLINTGFDFRLTSLPSTGLVSGNSSCHQLVQSSDLNGKDEGTLISLEHWYPPGTNCSQHLRGTDQQVVRLYFVKMKISEKDPIVRKESGCEEYLALYDSSWPDPRRIIKAFCDGFSKPLEKVDYISTGPSMFVNFVSKSGSYSGSSIYYWGVYDFHDTVTDGVKVTGTDCDEEISTSLGVVGKVRSPRNTLLFLSAKKDITCHYTIHSEPREYGRISILLEMTDLKPGLEQGTKGTKACSKCPASGDYLKVTDILSEKVENPLCISPCNNIRNSTEIISSGPRIEIKLNIAGSTALVNYFKKKHPIFQAQYSFLHPAVCGPTQLNAKNNGWIQFPDGNASNVEEKGGIYCVWDLDTRKGLKIGFQFGNITYTNDVCTEHSISLSLSRDSTLHTECGQSRRTGKLLTLPGKENRGQVRLTVKLKDLKQGQFVLKWDYN